MKKRKRKIRNASEQRKSLQKGQLGKGTVVKKKKRHIDLSFRSSKNIK